MIKKYNQFVKGKVNEEFMMADPETKPVTAPPTTTPDTRPTRPGVVPTTIPSEQDAPLARYEEEEVEQEGGDVYSDNLNTLSKLLPGSTVSNNSVTYKVAEGTPEKTILFPSETFNDKTGKGIFHVDKKKFDKVEDVVNYVLGESPVNIDEEPIGIDEDEYGDNYGKFESKSYKNTRLKKFKK